LALVFGNHAAGGKCPYYAAEHCRHCDIGAGEGREFTSELNRQRLAWFQDTYRAILGEVAHLVLYNSGSLLNPSEMPADLLDEILSWARSLPALKVISLESRESFVTPDSVRRVAGDLGPGQTARVIMGLETADDRLREDVLGKHMSRAAVERAVKTIGLAAADWGHGRIGLTCNVLVGGPGTSPSTVVADALTTARFALQIGRAAQVPVDLNLHPYYRSGRGQSCFPAHPRCPHEPVAAVASALASMLVSHLPPTVIFIGTEDEGHDQDLIASGRQIREVDDAFSKFNESQDPSTLQSLCLPPSDPSRGSQ